MWIKFLNLLCCYIFMLGGSVFGAQEKWNEYKAQHFIVYYKNAPQDFIKEIEETAESYYKEIADNLGFTRYEGWTWDDRAKIYVYNDSDDYVLSSQQAKWSHGVVSPRNKVIRTFPTAHGFFDSTLPHELGHIVLREFVGFKADLPLWFEEGVAMYQEKARRWGSHTTVKKAIENGTFITLEQLGSLRLTNESGDELVNLFYAESASVINYIINDLGKYRFVNFCRKLQEGVRFERALETVYGRFKNFQDLNKAWQDFLKTQ